MDNILTELSNAYCATDNTPVLWRIHPETMKEIVYRDAQLSYWHIDAKGVKTLCGKPIELDTKIKGWELWVECRNCQVEFAPDNFATATITVDNRGKCVKCDGTGIVLDANGDWR